ncbi:MAG: family 43 glycosylhydrolase [Prevotellaceae bacterium]|jgi:hypothetical protein|nr:family 43 glycosylhydrolase [Prevotellaceae bacterium]
MNLKQISLFFVALFCTVFSAKAQDASIVLSNTFVQNNLEHIYRPDNPSDEPYTVKTTKGGQQCIEIPAGKFGYFKTTNNVITQDNNNLIIKITYFDEGTGGLEFHYNSLISNGGNYNYKQQNIAKTNTNAWITATIALTDASFRKAQNQGADFRINSNNFIREITITKGVLNPDTEPLVTVTASAYSEFTGKSVAGYQCWFQTGNWFHWSNSGQPSPSNFKFEIYPDIAEYSDADLAQTGFANFGNGTSAKLFNSANTAVINKHFEWMETYGIDGAAVQRFINGIGSAINNSPASHLVKIKNAAEQTDRIFYICYDISSTGLDATWDDIIKFDWVYNIERNFELTQSPAYAKVGNKPVVQIWGTGFTDNHPGTEAETIALINFLKSRGCYVIGGVPTWWRTETGDSKPNFINAYNAYDMLSPWLVGRFSDNADADNKYNNPMLGDKTYCDAHNIDYMPVIFPGFAWSQWNSGNPNTAPRNAGEFMWKQAKNIKNLNVPQMYFAMFDEYDEGTAIMKAATDWTNIPTNQYFLTTSADGYYLSSDFQLRVAGAAVEMLKGTRQVTENVPVPHAVGDILYRNNFESRTTNYNFVNNVAQNTGTFPLDPCFKNPAQISISNVNTQSTAILQTNSAKTGLYVAEIKGNAASANGTYYYKFADVKIIISQNLKISFSKYILNNQGINTGVGIIFNDGTHIYDISKNEGTQNSWVDFEYNIGSENIGKTITGLVLGYNGTATGNFDAYFDNFLIQKSEDTPSNPDQPTYPAGYPKTQAMTNPLFWQFGSEKVNAAGELTGETGNLYTADASAHVWNINNTPTLFVYASHDMEQAAGCDRMDRYHVFSTTDMQNWTDYGEILNASQVPWHNGTFANNSKFMWAPDCAYKNGKYYFYFPHPSKNEAGTGNDWGNNWKIGIAVSDFPASNFTILPQPLGGLPSNGEIDPCIFVDEDGQAYFYYGGGGHCYGARMSADMLSLAEPLQEMQGLSNFHEATWIHKYNGKYYLSYSDNSGGGANNGDQLKYAVADTPLGTWESKGVYVYATGCGTNHGSIVNFNNQWYAFYHSDYISNAGENGRSVHFDNLYHNTDGTIQVVKNWGEPFNAPHNVIYTANTTDIALTLQAEDFNSGGETYGFHDRKAYISQNTNYRTVAGVVIENRNDGKTIGDIESKEFLRYTINAENAGLYDIDILVASENNGGKFHLNINGVNKSGTINVPNTGGWGTFQTVTATNIPLRQGENLFEIRFENGGFNLDKFTFRKAPAYSGTPYKTHNIPCKIEAEDYDLGCQGVAYFDTSGKNNGFYEYRNDCSQDGNLVDLEYSNNIINIAWTNNGEWTKYTLTATQSGIYDITIRVATGNGASGSLSLTFDDIDEYPAISAQTASWNDYEEVVLHNVSLSQGIHVMQMTIGGNINVDWFDFVKINDIPNENNEISDEKMIIYPNPVNYELIIINLELKENEVVEIFDIAGKKINHNSLVNQENRCSDNNGNLSINVSHLPTGIYFIKIGNNTGKFVKK